MDSAEARLVLGVIPSASAEELRSAYRQRLFALHPDHSGHSGDGVRTVIGANSYDFDLAQEYVAHFSTQLRAPDALHLAVAHNNGMEFVATLDEGMLAAAKKLKISAKRVIR